MAAIAAKCNHLPIAVDLYLKLINAGSLFVYLPLGNKRSIFKDTTAHL